MITIIEYQGKKVVSSLDVYKGAGYNPRHHSRWLVDFISTAQKNIDFFDITEPHNHMFPSGWKKRARFNPKQQLYFLTIDMAITACLIAKTEKAKKLKTFLQLQNLK